MRIITRMLLLPVISGIAYEVIKWAGKSESKLVNIIMYPGLMLQKLTTKEPDDEQLEVAIEAFLAVTECNESEMKDRTRMEIYMQLTRNLKMQVEESVRSGNIGPMF